jgi:hypothetical protein
MNQAEKKQDSKPEPTPQVVKCLPSCINRGTPTCKGCVNGSKYEWDYTEINGR